MKKVLLALLIGGVGFSSCMKESMRTEMGMADGFVTFRSDLSQTKATESSFESGDAVSIFASDEYSGALYSNNYANNSEYVYNSGEFRPAEAEDAVSYPDEYSSLYFYAVWPYSSSYSGSSLNFSVQIDQSTSSGYAASNLMLARTDATKAGTVDLNFDHMMSKVIINIKADSYPPGEWVSLFNNVYTDVALNLNEGSLDTKGSLGYVYGAKNGNNSFKVLLPPQTIQAGTQFFIFEIGEKGWQWKPSQTIILSPGVEYEYTLSI